ncbi:hypothetical protein [Aeromonas rivipollensis]|nr:hypothetical protein [Aeromonas media]
MSHANHANHANHAHLVNHSYLEAEIQCGSHAGVCHTYVTQLFYVIVMVV